MKHQSPNDFAAAPQRGRGRHSESELNRTLQQRFRPQERARDDAQRIDDAPEAIAAGFGDEIDGSRAEHYGVVRAEAMSATVSNTDAVGHLMISTDPAEADQTVRDTEAVLDRVDMERRKLAARAIETWQRGCAGFQAWADLSGAKQRHSPWPDLAFSLLLVVFAALAEVWLCAQLLAGPPIAGVPAPMVLGLLFAGGSLLIGAVAATGHMLAADVRPVHRHGGFGLLVLALTGWLFLCLTGAHMRACIELGGSGAVDEILASMRKGLFTPLVSPMALLLAGASAATTAVMWVKGVSYFGAPFGHRARDTERVWCVTQAHEAEEAHKDEIKAIVARAVAALETLEQAAWRPANDAVRLEREVQLIITQARESERAIDRAHRGQIVAYATTFRRVRPGVDLANALRLEPMAEDALGEPAALHASVAHLRRAAADVAGAVAEGKIRLRRAEVGHLTQIDQLYGETRRHSGRGSASSTPVIR